MITTEQKTKAGSQPNEHGVYVKNLKEIKVPFPKTAGKTQVVINLVQDLDDEMWRSSYSVRAGTGGASSLPSALSTPHKSREVAILAAAEKAREFLLSEVKRGNLSEVSKQQVRAALPALDKWIIAKTAAAPDDEAADEENGFHPGFPPGFDPKRAEGGLAQEDDFTAPRCDECKMIDGAHASTCSQSAGLTKGGTPFPTEFSQDEINRMAEYCAAGAIGEKNGTVKICYVEGQPFVITGTVSQGLKYLEVCAQPILPLENCGDRKVVTYSERVKSGVRGEGFYQDMKINCGSVKKPKWWVMVGPQMTFRPKTAGVGWSCFSGHQCCLAFTSFPC